MRECNFNSALISVASRGGRNEGDKGGSREAGEEREGEEGRERGGMLK